jgi:hypothetical protein
MTTYVWFVRGATHAAMCKTSIESVLRADPGAARLVVTDELSREWSIGTEHALVTVTSVQPSAPIMVANIEAQIHALMNGGKDYCFLDTDVLLLKPIPQVGDLTVTWRDHVMVADDTEEKIEGLAASMPYNYGVMRARYSQATVEAFIWLRERVRRMHPQQQQWYGNQLAMTELAGPRPAVGTQIDTRRIPWQLAKPSTLLAVGKIPCELYNYTPRIANEPLIGEPKHALHFKGKRRHLMADYAKLLGLGWYL